MADRRHLRILNQGVDTWNQWRREHPQIRPDLSEANLRDAVLIRAHLNGAILNLTDLTGAVLSGSDLSDANLNLANLTGAYLNDAVFRSAALRGAVLRGTFLSRADLTNAEIAWTTFADLDLSSVKGLDTVRQRGPCTIGIDTLYKSQGKIPESFLRGCGVPDDFITYARSLITKSIEFYSCFISYGHKDEDFAKRLHSRMRDEHLRVWYAPEDVKGGEKLHEQIERAIQVHDRLLIVLSENSLQSEWVMTEIRNARRAEIEGKRRKLFPIRLVDFDAIRKWKCFDADIGKDLAVELREYFIPDFSNWKDHDSFEEAFKRLLRDLRQAESQPPTS